MSGLGSILDIGKEALLAQKYALDVVSHNISNVNTAGYTRQSPTLVSKDAAPYAGVMLGRGVTIDEVIQNTDSFIEARLRERQTQLTSMSEQEVYLSAIESIFNENSGRSLSTQFSDFWAAWEDLSNNPSGMPERNILFEQGAFLAETFQELYGDLNEVMTEINNVIGKGVEEINTLLSNIADLNQQIIRIEVTGNANDLRDQRSAALTKLAEYMDVRSYEEESGNLTVTTGRGYVLVSKADAYPLQMNVDDVIWRGSGTTTVNITDMISGGKLGGWLEVRDHYIPEYQADLDALAGKVIWEVNRVHSQGVGLEGFGSVSGTYAVTDTTAGLSASGLKYQDFIEDGGFTVFMYDSVGATVGTYNISINAAADSLEDLETGLETASGGNLTVDIVDGKITITAGAGLTFAFSSDTSNVLAALGINTFFTGSSANDMGMNSLLNTDKELIAAGRAGTAGEIAVGDNANALALVEIQNESLDIERWTYERGSSPTSTLEKGTLESYLHSFVGSIGVDNQSIQRARQFNEVIVQELGETRDNISAVSLDEEMTNLIKFQQAYAAAAKLITVASEMLDTLLETV
ncbi:MAG: flagellar hook-associated protein FlgK [Desulfobacteraceae bacterium]|nr:MAG: flagellar hook-associated protein FlgK [Desulfobacteraceae bacterium]